MCLSFYSSNFSIEQQNSVTFRNIKGKNLCFTALFLCKFGLITHNAPHSVKGSSVKSLSAIYSFLRMFVYIVVCLFFIYFSAEKYRMASAAFSCGRSCYYLNNAFNCKSANLCSKRSSGVRECDNKQDCDQTCEESECDMECHGQNCEQECKHGASKCSLHCDSKQQCKQICKNDECDMKCHGQHCTQECKPGASRCNLQCDSNECKQICNNANCTLECHRQHCTQECKHGGSRCNLQCGSNDCKQICNKGDCTLKCHGPYCTQQCNGDSNSCLLQCPLAFGSNQCEQTCSPNVAKCNSTTNTMEKLTALTVALRTTSVHYYPCKDFCSGELVKSLHKSHGRHFYSLYG